jgi:threonine dehydrogenase-like Zn-dependent dehydrogenase
LPARLHEGDLVLCLGAGPIGALPERLIAKLDGASGAINSDTAASDVEHAGLRVVSGGRE